MKREVGVLAAVIAVIAVIAGSGCRRLATAFQPIDAEAPAPSASTTTGAVTLVPMEPEPTTEPAPRSPAPSKPASFPATCAGYCEHALRCASSFTPEENAACVKQCEAQRPTTARLAEMNAMSCPQILAAMFGGGGQPGPKPSPAPKPAAACTDCVGCHWEQDMCLYVHGYVATGIKQACKRCCCPGH